MNHQDLKLNLFYKIFRFLFKYLCFLKTRPVVLFYFELIISNIIYIKQQLFFLIHFFKLLIPCLVIKSLSFTFLFNSKFQLGFQFIIIIINRHKGKKETNKLSFFFSFNKADLFCGYRIYYYFCSRYKYLFNCLLMTILYNNYKLQTKLIKIIQ